LATAGLLQATQPLGKAEGRIYGDDGGAMGFDESYNLAIFSPETPSHNVQLLIQSGASSPLSR